MDFVKDAHGHSTQLGYDVWRIQSMRVYDDGKRKVHEFYWDLPDTAKVIKVELDRSYGVKPLINPALVFGDAPWAKGNERLSGILRGIQLYSKALDMVDVLSEVDSPLGTAAGSAAVWYLNLNPTPTNISDRSGRNHHPEWVGPARPKAWTGP